MESAHNGFDGVRVVDAGQVWVGWAGRAAGNRLRSHEVPEGCPKDEGGGRLDET